MIEARDKIQVCKNCGNLDESDTCSICRNESRDKTTVCIIKDVISLWSIEKLGDYNGLYFILNDSAIKSYNDSLENSVQHLKNMIKENKVEEIIFAMPLNIDGKTMQYFIMQELGDKLKYSELAHGVPIGSDLEYLDEGTLSTAMINRKSVN
jgi:recombination protein RecR